MGQEANEKRDAAIQEHALCGNPLPDGLVDGHSCEPDEAMRAAIVSRAKEMGMTDGEGYLPGMVLVYRRDMRPWSLLQTASDSAMMAVYRLIPPGEFYDRLGRTPRQEPPMRAGGHDVTFRKGCVRVGCTVVPNSTVRDAVSRLVDPGGTIPLEPHLKCTCDAPMREAIAAAAREAGLEVVTTSHSHTGVYVDSVGRVVVAAAVGTEIPPGEFYDRARVTKPPIRAILRGRRDAYEVVARFLRGEVVVESHRFTNEEVREMHRRLVD